MKTQQMFKPNGKRQERTTLRALAKLCEKQRNHLAQADDGIALQILVIEQS